MSGAKSRTTDGPGTWRERFQMLKYVPWILKLVWSSSRLLCSLSMLLRGIAAFLPLALLWISKLIVDAVVHAIATRSLNSAFALVAHGTGVYPGSGIRHPVPHDQPSGQPAGGSLYRPINFAVNETCGDP